MSKWWSIFEGLSIPPEAFVPNGAEIERKNIERLFRRNKMKLPDPTIHQRGSDTDVLRAYWLVVKMGVVEFKGKLSKLGYKDKIAYATSDEYKEHLEQVESNISWSIYNAKDAYHQAKRRLENLGLE